MPQLGARLMRLLPDFPQTNKTIRITGNSYPTFPFILYYSPNNVDFRGLSSETKPRGDVRMVLLRPLLTLASTTAFFLAAITSSSSLCGNAGNGAGFFFFLNILVILLTTNSYIIGLIMLHYVRQVY